MASVPGLWTEFLTSFDVLFGIFVYINNTFTISHVQISREILLLSLLENMLCLPEFDIFFKP